LPSACQVGHFICMSLCPTRSRARAGSSGAGRRCLLSPPLSHALNIQHPCFPGGWPFRGVQVPSYILPRIPVSTRPSVTVTCLGVGCVLVREGSLLLCLHAPNLRLQIQSRYRFRASHRCLNSALSLAQHRSRRASNSGGCQCSLSRSAASLFSLLNSVSASPSAASPRRQRWRLPAHSLPLRSSLFFPAHHPSSLFVFPHNPLALLSHSACMPPQLVFVCVCG
jgi:hypothetical protein